MFFQISFEIFTFAASSASYHMENHDDILTEFVNITGWPVDMCQDVLFSTGWDLSAALKCYLPDTQSLVTEIRTNEVEKPNDISTTRVAPNISIHEEKNVQVYETDSRWKVQITAPNVGEIKQKIMKYCPTVLYRYVEFAYINSVKNKEYQYQMINPNTNEIPYVIGVKYIPEQNLFEAIDSWLKSNCKNYHSIIGKDEGSILLDDEIETDSQTEYEQNITLLVQISGGKRHKIIIEENKSISKLFSRISILSKIKEDELLLKTYCPYQILKKSEKSLSDFNIGNNIIVATKK